MCLRATGVYRSAALLALCSGLFGQVTPGWHRVGGTSVIEGLAGPASGLVTQVWYSASGDRLLARTASGRVFETADPGAAAVAAWTLNTTDAAPPRNTASATGVVSPEPGAEVESAGSRIYAAGKSDIFVSEDGGATWVGATAWNGWSVLGGDFRSLAVSPADPLEVAVANAFGVWRSADGGMSWRSLNNGLPNLPVQKLLARYSIVLASGATAELSAGEWTASNATDVETALRTRFSFTAAAEVTAAAQTATVSYAGTADGRLLASRDGGATWSDVRRAPNGGPVNRIWVDSSQPELALASAAGRLLRTLSGGEMWDDVSGSLPDPAIHGIAADRLTDHVWIATGRGLFDARIPLNSATPAAPNWTATAAALPAAPAFDVRLNTDNTIEVALDGYGVYATDHAQGGPVHAANGADLSDRPAAPGSLISIIGAKVSSGKSGDVMWPVLAAAADSSQMQVPFDTAAGTLSLTVSASGKNFSVPVRVKEASPAIFIDADGAPLILDSASGLVLDAKSSVRPGSLIQVMATGLGRVNPDWPSGIPAPADAPPAVRSPVTAFLDGSPVEVTRATLAPGYVGYYVVELKIPASAPAGVRELRLVMNGEQSNPVKMYLDSVVTTAAQ